MKGCVNDLLEMWWIWRDERGLHVSYGRGGWIKSAIGPFWEYSEAVNMIKKWTK